MSSLAIMNISNICGSFNIFMCRRSTNLFRAGWTLLQRILLPLIVQTHCPYWTLYSVQQTFTYFYKLFPWHYMWLRSWEACNPNDSGSFAASHPPMHCSNRSIRKLSQPYATVENIIATVLASSMRVPFTSPTYILFKLAFFQSNRVSAI